MKKKLMPYLIAYAFLFVSYLFISLIMAILFSFIHVSSFIYQFIINIISYLIISITTLFFFKKIKEKPLLHGFIFSMIYLIFIFLFHLYDLHFTLFFKPLWMFMLYFILFYIKKKQQ